MMHMDDLARPPLDKDIFWVGTEIYQAITWIQPQDRVIALQKYQMVPFEAQDTFTGYTWVHHPSGKRFRRLIASYTVENATKNINNSRFSRHSSLYQGVSMIEVPVREIDRYYYPEDGLKRLTGDSEEKYDLIEAECLRAAEILHDFCHVPFEHLGVTGSILWEGHHDLSDLDLVIYGQDATSRVLKSIGAIIEAGSGITSISREKQQEVAKTLRTKTGLPIEECLRYVEMKEFYLTYHDRFLSLGFVPSIDEISSLSRYEDTQFKTIAPITIQARVIDESYGFYYPAILFLGDCKILKDEYIPPPVDPSLLKRVYILEREISSYARRGDTIEIRGLLQEVRESNEKYYQVYIGSMELYGDEYIRLIEKK